jgi:hypothetical protein
VRPTDEDQPGSRRPNLMSSSRRSAGDVNILAMLDGLGTRSRSRHTALWCGAAGALACAVLGSVAWLVHDPSPAPVQATVAVETPHAPAETALAGSTPAPVPDVAPSVPPARAGGATVVDVPAPPALDAGTVLAATPAIVPADAPRVLPAPKHAPPSRALATRQPMAHSPASHPGSAGVHPAPHPVAKRIAPASRPASGPAPADTDIALISAIIQHAANQHAANQHGAPADAGCTDKPCGPRTPPRP